MHFLQQGCALPTPVMEDALHEIESLRRFASQEHNEAALRDRTTILTRRLLRQGPLADVTDVDRLLPGCKRIR